MQLRDYQSEAVASVFDYFGSEVGSPLVVAPTGAGKSLIIAAFCRQACEAYPSTRILVLSHVKELIQQDHQQLMRHWPDARASIYSAGLGRKNLSGQVVFAGIQSFARVADRAGFFDLVIVDEAHLIPRKSGTLYRQTLEALAINNPAVKMVGFTATPYRLDSGMLHEGRDAVFDAICYDIPVGMLVERGYLAPLVSKRPSQTFDLSGLHSRAGEYIDAELSARFDNEDLNRAILAEAAELGADRQAWLVFCIDVAHAEHMATILRGMGKRAEVVSGKTPTAERTRVIEAYKRGDLDALASVGVLTTGFDAPRTDLIVMARPTQSTGLYVQIAGRGMRLKPQGGDCLVLDFAGNVMRHGPVDAINQTRPKKGDPDAPPGDAPAKACPECQSIVHAAVRECPDCGYLFPPPEVSIARTAGTDAIMRLTAPEPTWAEVQDVAYNRHRGRDGKPDSLRAEYLIDGQVAREWVCFEHSGYARQKAVAWWQERAGTPPPATVEEALSRIAEARRPIAAVPQRNGQYLNIGRVRLEVAA